MRVALSLVFCVVFRVVFCAVFCVVFCVVFRVVFCVVFRVVFRVVFCVVFCVVLCRSLFVPMLFFFGHKYGPFLRVLWLRNLIYKICPCNDIAEIKHLIYKPTVF